MIVTAAALYVVSPQLKRYVRRYDTKFRKSLGKIIQAYENLYGIYRRISAPTKFYDPAKVKEIQKLVSDTQKSWKEDVVLNEEQQKILKEQKAYVTAITTAAQEAYDLVSVVPYNRLPDVAFDKMQIKTRLKRIMEIDFAHESPYEIMAKPAFKSSVRVASELFSDFMHAGIDRAIMEMGLATGRGAVGRKLAGVSPAVFPGLGFRLMTDKEVSRSLEPEELKQLRTERVETVKQTIAESKLQLVGHDEAMTLVDPKILFAGRAEDVTFAKDVNNPVVTHKDGEVIVKPRVYAFMPNGRRLEVSQYAAQVRGKERANKAVNAVTPKDFDSVVFRSAHDFPEFERLEADFRKAQADYKKRLISRGSLVQAEIRLRNVRKMAKEHWANFVKTYQEALAKGQIKRKTITDAVLTETSVTRSFKTMRFEGHDYIVDFAQRKNELEPLGYCGVRLSDMINSTGRVIEGGGWVQKKEGNSFSPPLKVETRDTSPAGKIEMHYRLRHEPYITIVNGLPVIGIPSGAENWVLHQVMHQLDRESRTITEFSKLRRGQKLTSDQKYPFFWSFDVNYDLDEIMSRLGTVAMSNEARALIERKQAEAAEANKRARDVAALTPQMRGELGTKQSEVAEAYLGKVTEADIPDLKGPTEENGTQLFSGQKEAIAFVSKKGNGLIGLDTGTGKSLSAACIISKWIAEGDKGTLFERGRNGRVLFVCEAHLIGNMEREIRHFFHNPENILGKVDIATYEGFRRATVEHKPIKVARFLQVTSVEKALEDIEKEEEAEDLGAITPIEPPATEAETTLAPADDLKVQSRSKEAFDYAENYGAVFFDEAQHLKTDPGISHQKMTEEDADTGEKKTKLYPEYEEDLSQPDKRKRDKNGNPIPHPLAGKPMKFPKSINVSLAACMLDHPHKVLMTASVLEKSPDDIFNLAYITSNDQPPEIEDIEDPRKREKAYVVYHQRKLRDFRDKFCVTSKHKHGRGGKLIGLKTDKASRRKLAQWVRNNCVSVDKQENLEYHADADKWAYVDLPGITQSSPGVVMDPFMQKVYLQLTEPIRKHLKEVKKRYLEIQKAAKSGKPTMTRELETESMAVGVGIKSYQRIMNQINYLTSAPQLLAEKYPHDPNIKLFEELRDHYTQPETATGKVPRSPKEQFVVEDLTENAPNARTIIWSDIPRIAIHYGELMSKEIPKLVAVALASKEIQLWRNGKKVDQFTPTNNPWETVEDPETGRKTNLWHEESGKVIKGDYDGWETDAFKLINGIPNVGVLVMTKAFAKGQNCQGFTRTIHLDRDQWNNENMKQRDARNWRTGQKNAITSIVPDAVFDVAGEHGESIDMIRKWSQETEARLFKEIVRDSFAPKNVSEEMDPRAKLVFENTADQINKQKMVKLGLKTPARIPVMASERIAGKQLVDLMLQSDDLYQVGIQPEDFTLAVFTNILAPV